jgi:hypothetical protein
MEISSISLYRFRIPKGDFALNTWLNDTTSKSNKFFEEAGIEPCRYGDPKKNI